MPGNPEDSGEGGGGEKDGEEGEEKMEEEEGRRCQVIQRTGDWEASLSFPRQEGPNYPSRLQLGRVKQKTNKIN